MKGWLFEDDDDELEEDVVGNDDEEEMEMDENDEENGGNDDEDDAESVPPVIQFGGNFHVGESSSIGDLLAGNGWVHVPGPMGCNLESVHRGVKRLDKKMFDRYNTEIRMAKKFKEDDLRINRHEYDITTLDAEEEAFEPPIHLAFASRLDDSYAIARDAAIAARDDDGDDTTAPMDSQPSEPRGSPRDPH
ncbi:hypothetical protein Tco_1463935 [Tanacetum coccineum]